MHEQATSVETCQSPTSRWSVLMLLAAGAMILAARAPAVYDYLAANVPEELSNDIADPALERLALRTALVLGLVIALVSYGILLALAVRIEKSLGAPGIGRGRMRIGLTVTTLSVVVFTQQAADVLLGVERTGTTLTSLLLTTSAMAVALLAFRVRRPSPTQSVYWLTGLLCLLATMGGYSI